MKCNKCFFILTLLYVKSLAARCSYNMCYRCFQIPSASIIYIVPVCCLAIPAAFSPKMSCWMNIVYFKLIYCHLKQFHSITVSFCFSQLCVYDCLYLDVFSTLIRALCDISFPFTIAPSNETFCFVLLVRFERNFFSVSFRVFFLKFSPSRKEIHNSIPIFSLFEIGLSFFSLLYSEILI